MSGLKLVRHQKEQDTAIDARVKKTGDSMSGNLNMINNAKLIGNVQGNATTATTATTATKVANSLILNVGGLQAPFNGQSRVEVHVAPNVHNHGSDIINQMTGYVKGNTSSAITTSDTLNSAVGKLENKVDSKANSTHTHNYAGSNTAGGSANSAVKLQNARNITIGNATQSFNGSASISYTLPQVGAVQFEYSSDPVVNGSRIPTIFADGAEWLMTRSGGIVPHRNEGGYLGVPTRKFYDVHTLHINGLHVGGHSNNRRWELIPLVNDQGVMEIGKYVDFHNSKASTSDYTYRLQNDGSTLLCSGTLSQMSDRNLKENIEYLSEVDVIGLNSKIKKQTFIDFIREFRFATYNYKGAKENNFGFIAQDIQDSHIGKYMLRECNIVDFDPITKEKIGEKECLAFDITAYTSIVARALQEEVLLRDKQIESLEEKIKLLEKKIGALAS